MKSNIESTSPTQEKNYLEVKKQAQFLIWTLVRATNNMLTDTSSFIFSTKLQKSILTIEWLSAIACDDWCDHPSQYVEIYNEINDHFILTLEDESLSLKWKIFCDLIAVEARKPTGFYGQKEMSISQLERFKSWKIIGNEECWLLEDAHFLNSIIHRDSVYKVQARSDQEKMEINSEI